MLHFEQCTTCVLCTKFNTYIVYIHRCPYLKQWDDNIIYWNSFAKISINQLRYGRLCRHSDPVCFSLRSSINRFFMYFFEKTDTKSLTIKVRDAWFRERQAYGGSVNLTCSTHFSSLSLQTSERRELTYPISELTALLNEKYEPSVESAQTQCLCAEYGQKVAHNGDVIVLASLARLSSTLAA